MLWGGAGGQNHTSEFEFSFFFIKYILILLARRDSGDLLFPATALICLEKCETNSGPPPKKMFLFISKDLNSVVLPLSSWRNSKQCSLIWVYTVCPDLSVQNFRIITRHYYNILKEGYSRNAYWWQLNYRKIPKNLGTWKICCNHLKIGTCCFTTE